MSLILVMCQHVLVRSVFRENSRESREPHENFVLGRGALDRYTPLLAFEHLNGLSRWALDSLHRVDVRLGLRIPVGKTTL